MSGGRWRRVNRFTFAHGVSFEFEFVSVVHESVENGIGDSAVTECSMPLVERQLASNEGGASVVTIIQDLE